MFSFYVIFALSTSRYARSYLANVKTLLKDETDGAKFQKKIDFRVICLCSYKSLTMNVYVVFLFLYFILLLFLIKYFSNNAKKEKELLFKREC